MTQQISLSMREREIRCVQFKSLDRLPFRMQFGLMPGLLEKWHQEGLPAEIQDLKSLSDYFGLDRDGVYLPVHRLFAPQFEQTILSDDEKERIQIDEFGRKTKLLKKYASKALPVEYPVSDYESWQPYKQRLQFSPSRINSTMSQIAEQNIKDGYLNRFGTMGFFWMPRELMGIENLSIAYYEQPELVHDILDTWCSLLEKLLETICKQISLDKIHLAEDMAYKNGPMISQELFDNFMEPYYQRINKVLQKYKIPVFSVDSDGNLNELVDWLKPCGVNLIGPCEVQAGCDLKKLRQKHDCSMAFFGGLDKMVIPQGRDAIDEMLTNTIPFMKSKGGWMVSLDHRVVDNTTLDDFKYYVDRTKEMLSDDHF